MSSIEAYQKLVDGATKPGKKIDLINDDIRCKIYSSDVPETSVALEVGKNSSFRETSETNPAPILTHTRYTITNWESDYFYNSNFDTLTEEQKNEFIRTEMRLKYPVNVDFTPVTEGYYKWKVKNTDLLYYGSGVVLKGFREISLKTEQLPRKSEIRTINGVVAPVMWVGSALTVLPVSWLENMIDSTGSTKITDGWTVVNYGLNQGIRTAIFDWSGTWGTPEGILLINAEIAYKSNYTTQLLTLKDGSGVTYNLYLHPVVCESDEFWGIPDNLARAHFEPGSAAFPIQLTAHDLNSPTQCCWIFIRDALKNLTPQQITSIFLPSGISINITIAQNEALRSFKWVEGSLYCLYAFNATSLAKYKKGETITIDLSTRDSRLGKIYIKGFLL